MLYTFHKSDVPKLVTLVRRLKGSHPLESDLESLKQEISKLSPQIDVTSTGGIDMEDDIPDGVRFCCKSGTFFAGEEYVPIGAEYFGKDGVARLDVNDMSVEITTFPLFRCKSDWSIAYEMGLWNMPGEREIQQLAALSKELGLSANQILHMCDEDCEKLDQLFLKTFI